MGQRAGVPVITEGQRGVQLTLVFSLHVCVCVRGVWGALCMGVGAETGLVFCLLCLISLRKEIRGPV